MKKLTILLIVLASPLFVLAQSAEECYKKGQDYAKGLNGVTADYKEAFNWFLKAAEKGHIKSQAAIGGMYYMGLGVTKSNSEAIKWYTKAANQGDLDSQNQLGNLYTISQEFSEGLAWHRKAADRGNVQSQTMLGTMYFSGLGTDRDYAEASKWFRKAASQGDAIAQNALGEMYRYGYGMKVNHTEAFKLFKQAAEQGNADGQDNLGDMYYKGYGVSRSYSEALKWYLKSADQGNSAAQSSIGDIYYLGLGVKVDYTEALKWYRRAADRNEPEALYSIGLAYRDGHGVKADPAEAAKWFRKAANLEHDKAQNLLGMALTKGNGVKQDYTEAIKWFRLAADNDNYAAMNNLGHMYHYGKGVPVNLETAREWYKKSLKEKPDYKTAKDNLASVEKAIAEQSSKNKVAQNSAVAATPMQKNVSVRGNSPIDTQIPQTGKVSKNTFAIIIANENYSRETQVDYAINDGEVFRDYCQKTLGLPVKNIHYVANATLNDMIGELDWLQQVCTAYKGDASVIFYYAGHGLPDEATGSSYLLPIDGNSRILRTCYSTNELYQLLGQLPAKKVTVLMDACFSGAKRDGNMMASARGVAIKAKNSAPQGKMIVMSAATGDETAYKYDEMKHGLFTYFLLKKLKDTKGNVSLGDLSKYITDEVGRYSIVENGKSQTPTVQVTNALKPTWKSLKLE